MHLTFADRHIFVKTDEPRQKHLLKHYHNAVEVKRGWRLPLHIWAMRELVKSFPELKEDQEFLQQGTWLRMEMDQHLDRRKSASAIYEGLRMYQNEDVSYLLQLPQAGVFNEPRTGKTPTVITLLKRLELKRNLIVAPASLIWNWEAELKKWWPECEALVVTDRSDHPLDWVANGSGPRVIVVSKDRLKTKLKLFTDVAWNTMIVDEAHFLRNWKTAQSKAICSIRAERRYALTGTPTVKHPSDIYGILHFLFPEQYSSYWQFVERYFEVGTYFMGHNVVGKIKPHREKELQEIVGLLSVQRKRKDVMPWLPEKERTTFHCKMEGKQLKLYKEMQKDMLASDLPTEVDAQNVIVQLMRLRQLAADPRLLGFDVIGAKTKSLLEYLENSPGPLVVMSWFTSYLKLLKTDIEKLGLKVGMIHGEMSGKEKQHSAKDFQGGNIDILLCNIISAGVGHTLDASDTIIFLDKAWNPSDNEQAEDRVCPTTEEKNHKHSIITFVSDGSIDEHIHRLVEQKKSLTDVINEGGAAAIRRLLGG